MVFPTFALRIWPRIIPEAVWPGNLGVPGTKSNVYCPWHSHNDNFWIIFVIKTTGTPLPLACLFHWRSHSGVYSYLRKRTIKLGKLWKKWNCTMTFFTMHCLILDLQLFDHLIMTNHTKIAACSWAQSRQRRSGPKSKMNSLSFQNGQRNMELWHLFLGDSQKGATRSLGTSLFV